MTGGKMTVHCERRNRMLGSIAIGGFPTFSANVFYQKWTTIP